MRKRVLAILMALVALCAFTVAEETAEDWVKTGDEPLVGDPPEEMWNRTYGGPSNELASEVHVTKDGGYIIIGVTESYGVGDGDAWLIKTDSEGSEEWNKTFGGPGDDQGFSVQQTRDNGYIITGFTKSYSAGNSDIWLIKTDRYGMKQWDKTFGGPGLEEGRSVMETRDGGYIIAGGTESYGAGSFDIWLIKTDSEGNKEWERTFGGPNYDWAFSVQQTEDDGYVITGTSCSYDDTGKGDLWLIKTDPEGNKEWERTFGGPGHDAGRFVREISDGGYVIVGDTQSYGAGIQDIWVIKTDAHGTEKWNRTFGGSGFDSGYSILEIGNGNGDYLIVGHTESHEYLSGSGTAWLIKVDSGGNKKWNKTFGNGGTQAFKSVQETGDGTYIIAGDSTIPSSLIDVWLVKVKVE